MSIPVTVLGGFLGAGKTTALNALLHRATARIAVLVNDFGAINVDSEIIAAREGGMVALGNGCVCCATGDDLGGGIARLAGMRPPPDLIVVEASGVSDPWRVAQLVRLEAGVHLDAVLVLADAQRFPKLLADRWLADTLERQVARADLVLLTHADLASAAEVEATRAALRRLRPDVAMAVMPADGLPEVVGATHEAPRRLVADAVSGHGFRRASWSPPGSLDRAGLLRMLDALPDSVLRVKGFCRLGPGGAQHLVQRAGRRSVVEPWPHPVRGEALVFIGTPDMPEEATSLFPPPCPTIPHQGAPT